MLLAYQRPAVKRIAAARPQKYHALCLITKNIPTRPMRLTRSSVRVPEDILKLCLISAKF
jgi:hypothetical protein